MALKPFVAYDADGKEYAYKTALDARQACELAGYTLTKPGSDPTPSSVAPRQDYANMNSDMLRKQCLVRQIPNYMNMERDEWIEALKARDLEDAARLSGLKPAPVAATVALAAEPEKSNKPKNKPAA